MTPKQLFCNLKLRDLTPAQANIIKQDMLSIGGEAAVARGAVACSVKTTDAVVSGTLKQLHTLAEKLNYQSFGLREVAAAMARALENVSKESVYLKGRTRAWDLGERTLVMGILNVTPDSFSDGGAYSSLDAAVERGVVMAARGADLVDVGGESTRPGSEPVPVDVEIERVVPVVEALAEKGVVVSVDTSKAEVARRALGAGAEMINDVTALKDPEMAGVVRDAGGAVMLMHMRGTPATMQADVEYEDVMQSVVDYLYERVEYAVGRGIDPERIMVDPGLGFGKSVEGNLELIQRLGELKALGRPVLVGASRKSFIGKITSSEVGQRLPGTLAATVASVMNGAHAVRVHDVAEAADAVRVADAIKAAGIGQD